MSQIEGYHTCNQGGQLIDLHLLHRYDQGLPEDRPPTTSPCATTP